MFENLSSEELDRITLKAFLEKFEVLNDDAARQRGFELHHLEPIAVQLSAYNLQHPENPLTRKDFRKHPERDQRCILLSPFDHILVHYLLAKEKEEPYLRIFYAMVRQNLPKISEKSSVTLQNLKEWTTLRETGKIKAVARTRETKNSAIWQATKGVEYRKKQSERSKEKHNNLGRVYITNGTKNRMIPKDSEIPEGWRRGKTSKNSKPEKRRLTKEEIHEIRSKAHIGIKRSEESRRKQSETLKGHPTSPETREKISKALKGNQNGKGKVLDRAAIERIAAKNRGQKRSLESRKKMSESHKGQKPWLKGKHHSEETKKKLSEAHKGKRWYTDGEKSHAFFPGEQPEGWILGKASKNKSTKNSEKSEI